MDADSFRGRRSTAQDPDLGSTARVLVSRVRGRVLLVAQGSRVAGPVAVVYHASPSGQLALGTAMELVAGRERDLVVLSLSGRDQVVESTADELSRRGLQIKTDVRIRDFVFTDVPHLLATVHAAGANVLVVPAGGQGVPGNVIEDLARRFLGHVLIVAGDLET